MNPLMRSLVEQAKDYATEEAKKSNNLISTMDLFSEYLIELVVMECSTRCFTLTDRERFKRAFQ